MTAWTRVEPAVEGGGDVGGDIQATESYSVRFKPLSEPDDGVHALVTAYFFGARQPTYGADPPAGDDGFWVAEQVEFLLCTDPADPGGTEVWSDYQYHDYPDRYGNAEVAERVAQQMAVDASCEAVSWDGRSPIWRA